MSTVVEVDNKKEVVQEEPKQEVQKKRIGIVAYKIASNTLGVTLPYINFMKRFGEVHLISPINNEIRRDLDLLVLPGGPDVDPNRYDNYVSFFTGSPDPIREWFDINILPKYIENRTAIFGICRGHQTLAVHFGGTLNQHMWHETNKPDEREKLVHFISIKSLDGSTYTQEVNSLHHQTIRKVPSNAQVIAWYSKDKKFTGYGGIDKNGYAVRNQDIEAIYYKDYPAASVQWHPEEIWDELAIELIESLL